MSNNDKPKNTTPNNDLKDSNNQSLKIVQAIIKSNYNSMDNNNKAAADILATGNVKEAVNFMMTDQKTGRTLSYAEMRGLYGYKLILKKNI